MESGAYRDADHYWIPSVMRQTTMEWMNSQALELSSPGASAGRLQRRPVPVSVSRQPAGLTTPLRLGAVSLQRPEFVNQPVEYLGATMSPLHLERIRRRPVPVSMTEVLPRPSLLSRTERHSIELEHSIPPPPPARSQGPSLELESSFSPRPPPVSRLEHHELGFELDSPLLSTPASRSERSSAIQSSENSEEIENNTTDLAEPEVRGVFLEAARAQSIGLESARDFLDSVLTSGSRNFTAARPATPFAYSGALPDQTPVYPSSSERTPRRSPLASRLGDRGGLDRESGNSVGGFDFDAIVEEALARGTSTDRVYRELYRRRQESARQTATRPLPPSLSPPLPTTRIASPVPQYNYTAPSGDSTCSICLETLTSTNQNFTTLLHCNHAFHHDCIRHWLQQVCRSRSGPTCPLCRQKVSTVVQNNGPNNEAGAHVDVHEFSGGRTRGRGFGTGFRFSEGREMRDLERQEIALQYPRLSEAQRRAMMREMGESLEARNARRRARAAAREESEPLRVTMAQMVRTVRESEVEGGREMAGLEEQLRTLESQVNALRRRRA